MGGLLQVWDTRPLGILCGCGPLPCPRSRPKGSTCPQRGWSWGVPDIMYRDVTPLESLSFGSYKARYPGRVTGYPAVLNLFG